MERVHGGNLRELASAAALRKEALVDFSANINPLGPPVWLRQMVNRNLDALSAYPDPRCSIFIRAAASFHDVPPENIVPGNGASEIIFALPNLYGIERALIPVPTYGDYQHSCKAAGVPVELLPLPARHSFALDYDEIDASLAHKPGVKTAVWIGQPNNPTGKTFDSDRLSVLCKKHDKCIFIIDESFADFMEGHISAIHLEHPNVVVIRSLTKFYGVPGLRAGYAVCPSAAMSQALRDTLPTWSVNTLAQIFAEKAFGDADYQTRSRDFMTGERRRFSSNLSKIPGLTAISGEANYLLLKIGSKSHPNIAEQLLDDGLVVRTCDDFDGLGPDYIRVAIRSELDNDRLYSSLVRILSGTPRIRSGGGAPKAARIMVQGTASNAGKSILTAALCRILLGEGVRVAPFKAQNMSLNSYVTADGGEMGRAQVVQAQACHIAPDVRMNPVLLKPSSSTGSQVILRGKPVGFMEAKKYQTDKTELFGQVTACFDDLAAEYDAIVMEGAGSPGEVNLKRYDIVNMRMAAHARAPVLLVGDIDRGGVFAAFIGTMDVLDEWERQLIKGFVINKFRGDPDLLESAISYTCEYTGKPTLGIVPMIQDLGIPDEDSVSFKMGQTLGEEKKPSGSVSIALIDLPHISNFTDFDPFKHEPDVDLIIARKAEDIDGCDAIIIPGSKNVFTDLKYLNEKGIGRRIALAAESEECCVIGVCGGYQMLGRSLADPQNVESTDGMVDGLGLLTVDTVLGKGKILEQTSAKDISTGLELQGYEIHHGRTVFSGVKPWIERPDGEVIGVSHPELCIHGTYLHGLFDADRFRRWFIDSLRATKGMEPIGKVLYTHDVEPSLDRLARIVKEHVDFDTIRTIMGL